MNGEQKTLDYYMNELDIRPAWLARELRLSDPQVHKLRAGEGSKVNGLITTAFIAGEQGISLEEQASLFATMTGYDGKWYTELINNISKISIDIRL